MPQTTRQTLDFFAPNKNKNEFYLFVGLLHSLCCSLGDSRARQYCARHSDSAILNFCHCWSFNSIFTQSYHCHLMSSLKSHRDISHIIVVRCLVTPTYCSHVLFFRAWSSILFFSSFPFTEYCLSPVGCRTASPTHKHLHTDIYNLLRRFGRYRGQSRDAKSPNLCQNIFFFLIYCHFYTHLKQWAYRT